MNDYIMSESKQFSNGTEYEVFMYNYCGKCKKGILRDDLFPEFPENGGCPIWDAMENARFNPVVFPSKKIVEIRNNEGEIIKWHHCTEFEESEVKQ